MRTSVCELAKHPERFDNRRVTVRARYGVNWEWGAWLRDDRCEASSISYLAPSAYGTPPEYKDLAYEPGFRDFDEQERKLCNGMTGKNGCGDHVIEADFSGIFVAAQRKRQRQNGLVVLDVRKLKVLQQ